MVEISEKIVHNAYRYNLNVVFFTVGMIILNVFTIVKILPQNTIIQGLTILIFVFAIMAHVQDRKLKLVSIGSILIYISEIIGLPLLVMAVMNASILESEIFMGLSGLLAILSVIIKIIAATFCALTARKIKRDFLNQHLKENSVKNNIIK